MLNEYVLYEQLRQIEPAVQYSICDNPNFLRCHRKCSIAHYGSVVNQFQGLLTDFLGIRERTLLTAELRFSKGSVFAYNQLPSPQFSVHSFSGCWLHTMTTEDIIVSCVLLLSVQLTLTLQISSSHQFDTLRKGLKKNSYSTRLWRTEFMVPTV